MVVAWSNCFCSKWLETKRALRRVALAQKKLPGLVSFVTVSLS